MKNLINLHILKLQGNLQNIPDLRFEITFTEAGNETISQNNFKKYADLFYFKENWKDKIGAVTTALLTTGSPIDILAALTPTNEGEQGEYYKIATVFFKIENLYGQTELLQEVKNNVITKQFTLTTFYISVKSVKKTLCEIGAGWEEGLTLCAMSIKDFHRNPKSFVLERLA